VKKHNVISSPVTSYAKTAAGNASFFIRLLLASPLIACNDPDGPAGKTGKKGTDTTVIVEQEE
jgi:hypothetical protein